LQGVVDAFMLVELAQCLGEPVMAEGEIPLRAAITWLRRNERLGDRQGPAIAADPGRELAHHHLYVAEAAEGPRKIGLQRPVERSSRNQGLL
jgi:hypothetical protein